MTKEEQELLKQCYKYHIDTANDLDVIMEELEYFRDMASRIREFIQTPTIKRKYVYDSGRENKDE